MSPSIFSLVSTAEPCKKIHLHQSGMINHSMALIHWISWISAYHENRGWGIWTIWITPHTKKWMTQCPHFIHKWTNRYFSYSCYSMIKMSKYVFYCTDSYELWRKMVRKWTVPSKCACAQSFLHFICHHMQIRAKTYIYVFTMNFQCESKLFIDIEQIAQWSCDLILSYPELG